MHWPREGKKQQVMSDIFQHGKREMKPGAEGMGWETAKEEFSLGKLNCGIIIWTPKEKSLSDEGNFM